MPRAAFFLMPLSLSLCSLVTNALLGDRRHAHRPSCAAAAARRVAIRSRRVSRTAEAAYPPLSSLIRTAPCFRLFAQKNDHATSATTTSASLRSLILVLPQHSPALRFLKARVWQRSPTEHQRHQPTVCRSVRTSSARMRSWTLSPFFCPGRQFWANETADSEGTCLVRSIGHAESSRAFVALVAIMLFIDLRGVYHRSGLCPAACHTVTSGAPHCRAPATSPTMPCRCGRSHRLPFAAVLAHVPLPALRGRRRPDRLDRPCGLSIWRSGCRGGGGRGRGCWTRHSRHEAPTRYAAHSLVPWS